MINSIKCKLCAGSPDIQIYPVVLTDQLKNDLNRECNVTHVDLCIGKEIQDLINNGIKLSNSCCGHGENEPHALCLLESESLLIKYGYRYEKDESSLITVYLKTDTQKELMNILGNKVWRYLEGPETQNKSF